MKYIQYDFDFHESIAQIIKKLQENNVDLEKAYFELATGRDVFDFHPIEFLLVKVPQKELENV